MAYSSWITLYDDYLYNFDGSLGSVPIGYKIYYAHERNGVNVNYKIKTVLWLLNSYNYFTDTFYQDIYFESDTTHRARFSNQSDSSGWSFTNEQAFTITNKTSGTTYLKIKAYNANNSSSRDQTFEYYDLIVPAYIPPTPTAPTSCKAEGSSENVYYYGDTMKVSWSGATGTITGYDIEYKTANKDTGNYGDWISLVKNQSGSSYTVTSNTLKNSLAGTKIMFRVRAVNGSLTSSFKESGELVYKGVINIQISGAWKKATAWIKIGGTWKRVKKVHIKNTQWKETK